MTTPTKARTYKIPTARNLENAALFYLSRYAASESSLRGVLENKLRRAGRRNPAFANDDTVQNLLRTVIDGIIEKHKKTGALNDAAYAEMKTNSLRRAGRSARAIRQRLGQSGVGARIVDDALARNDDETAEESELKAALILARRKKLGPFRAGAADFDRKRKDLATLARAGFSLGVAQKVLGTSVDDLEQLEAGG